MGRSNAAPVDPKDQRNGNIKQLSKSATFATPDSSSKHHLKLPHPHLPFHHGKTASPNNSTPPTPHYPQLSSSDKRPATMMQRQNSVRTRYMNMLLSLDEIPRLHNILAALFTWILLAGFLIFPGTFTTISSKLSDDDSQSAQDFVATIKHIQLVVIGGVCSGVGALGMTWLWYRWRNNYVWLLNRIFLPGCLNSLAGLISTLIGVYGQQNGIWSTIAKVTAAVTGGIMVVTGALFAIYNWSVLRRIKSKHRREMEFDHEGETVVEKLQRQAHEPALEPGSVV